MATTLDYSKKTFNDLQVELRGFIEKYYPDSLQDFTDATIGSLLLDLCAAVGENLHFNLDRAFQETQIDYAQQRKSIINIARTQGVKIPNLGASVTICDFSVSVPVRGDSFDTEYLPVLKAGAQVQGGGKVFETLDDIDFSKSTNSNGSANRIIKPNYDANNIIQSYTIIKKELVYGGKTKIYKTIIRQQDSVPFFKIQLPEQDVLKIDSVIALNGINYSASPTDAQFNNPENVSGEKYYEVDFLAQKEVFLKKNTSGDTNSLISGEWTPVLNRFIKEYTSNGFCQLTFGGGNRDYDGFKTAMESINLPSDFFIANFYKTSSLGVVPKPNTTIFVKYKTGGGSSTNVGAKTLTNLGYYQMDVNGPNATLNSRVYSSLKVVNNIPAFGGRDRFTTEELRYYTKYNASTKRRNVHLNDYISLVYEMDGVFGKPFRICSTKVNNKVIIGILGLDENGKLSNTSNSILKDNISNYLKNFRNINDYVTVKDGKIFNISCELTLLVDEGNKLQIASSAIDAVTKFFDITKHQMNQDIHIGLLIKELTGLPNIINVIDYKFFNKVGGQYSLNPIEMSYKNNTTKEILLQNNTLYSVEDSMFEIKYPEKDIKIILNYI